jgi:basic membrane protein A and related proteins
MKTSAKVKAVILVMLFALLLSACAAPAEEETTQEGPFRVAMIMPSAINDLAFSQSIYDAVTTIQTEMGGPDNFEFVYS